MKKQSSRQLKVDFFELIDELRKVYDPETVVELIRLIMLIEES